MLQRLAADLTLLAHLAFIVFVMLGGLLSARWRWMPLVQLPAAAWGVFVELSGWGCPLTYLENHFRAAAGQAGYQGSFVEHYLQGILYPSGLNAAWQGMLALLVIVTNIAIYGWIAHKRSRAP